MRLRKASAPATAIVGRCLKASVQLAQGVLSLAQLSPSLSFQFLNFFAIMMVRMVTRLERTDFQITELILYDFWSPFIGETKLGV